MSVSAPLTLALFGCWVADPDMLDVGGDDYRVHVLFVAYQLLLMVSLSAGIVACVASGQIATARAFTAGYNTGLAVSRASQEDDDGDGDGHHQWPKPMPLRLLR